jgi:hypothetical protein
VANPEVALTSAARITNTTLANYGEAVELASGMEAKNLIIVNSIRGGIYRLDVTDVSIVGNNLSGTNTSCVSGFIIYFPTDIPVLPNGWAAIMVDEDTGNASLSFINNYVHDETCNDGVDIRANGTAQVVASVDSNTYSDSGGTWAIVSSGQWHADARYSATDCDV